MNKKLFVCCLNIQEARNTAIISQLKTLCSSNLISSFVDTVYNRSNLSFCGEDTNILNIIDDISDVALQHVNINSTDRDMDSTMHHHVGILDLIPVHPLLNTNLSEAGDLAVGISNILNSKSIPTLLFGSADKTNNRSLVEVRKKTTFFDRGQVSNRLQVEGHPTMGISVVGASNYVLAYNMVLNTDNIGLIEPIIPDVRDRAHGVQVMAYKNTYQNQDIVEIACNLTDLSNEKCSPEFVLSKTKHLISHLNLDVIHCYSTNPTFSSILQTYLQQN